jgi:hypothetical protein
MSDSERPSCSERVHGRLALALLGLGIALGPGLTSARAEEVPDSDGEPPIVLTPMAAAFEEELGGRAPTEDSHFLFSAVSTFSPYDSSVVWTYAGAGCRSRTSGSSWFDMDLHLPDDAILDYVRVYFNDTDATHDVTVTLMEVDGGGSATTLASATGSGTPGWSSAGSGFFSHRVDNVAAALLVRVGLGNATTLALQACGVRVRYSPAGIFADGFEAGTTAAWTVVVP